MTSGAAPAGRSVTGRIIRRYFAAGEVTFDKTGTLTYGNFVVSDMVSFDSGLSEAALLQMAAPVEALSEQPLAMAIGAYAQKKPVRGNTIKFSLGLSFVAIFLSVQGDLTPTSGALVHNVGSVLVVLIAALLYERKFTGDELIANVYIGTDLITDN